MTVEALSELGAGVVEAIVTGGGEARVLGGIGIELSAGPRPPALARPIEDVDVLCRRGDRKLAERALTASDLVPDRQVNAAHGAERQVWWTSDGRLHLDLFLGAFRMCHILDLDDRLGVPGAGPALNAADLLLTKLQIVRLTEKDVRDVGALLNAVEPDADRIAEVCGRDWGLYTTAHDNLSAIPPLVGDLDPALEPVVAHRAERLRTSMAAAPKTRAWRLRARLGRRVRWYEEPEEVIDE